MVQCHPPQWGSAVSRWEADHGHLHRLLPVRIKFYENTAVQKVWLPLWATYLLTVHPSWLVYFGLMSSNSVLVLCISRANIWRHWLPLFIKRSLSASWAKWGWYEILISKLERSHFLWLEAGRKPSECGRLEAADNLSSQHIRCLCYKTKAENKMFSLRIFIKSFRLLSILISFRILKVSSVLLEMQRMLCDTELLKTSQSWDRMR